MKLYSTIYLPIGTHLLVLTDEYSNLIGSLAERAISAFVPAMESLQKAFHSCGATHRTHHRLSGGIPHLEKKLAGKKVYSICPSVKQGTSEYPKSSGVTIPAGPPPWV